MSTSKGPQVSIVVPVFNAASFLPESLPCLLEGQGDACEIIAIDDASTDNSLQILQHHAAKYSSLRVVSFKGNRGVSAARNHGLELARGQYVLFVDADDQLHHGAVPVLLKTATERHRPDIIFFQHRRVKSPGNFLPRLLPKNENLYDLTDTKQRRFAFAAIVGNLLVWNGFFRRESLGNLHFQPYPNGEDVLFGVQAFCRARTLLIVPNVLYDYILHSGTASRVKNTRHCKSSIDVACEIMATVQATPFYGQVKDILFRKLRSMTHGTTLAVLLAVPQSERDGCWSYWFDHLESVFSGSDLAPTRQDWLYRLIFRLRSRWMVLLMLYLPIRIKGRLLSHPRVQNIWR